jgi:four helix bundle protein
MATHKDLNVWRQSLDLVEEIYRITAGFPKEELYGLTAQMRRCAVSVPSNIAEGAARQTKKEYIQFLYISLGSLSELETQIEISARLKYLAEKSSLEKIENIRKMLLNFLKYMKSSTGHCYPPTLQPSNP